MGVDTQERTEQCKESQSSIIFKSDDGISLVSGLYSISSKVFSSLSLPLYKLLDPESHLRSTTTGPHRQSEELVPLVSFEWRSYCLPISFSACIKRARKKSISLYFSPDFSVLQTPSYLPTLSCVFPNKSLGYSMDGFLLCCNGNHNIPLTILGHLQIISVLEYPVQEKWTRALDSYSSIWTWTKQTFMVCSLFTSKSFLNYFSLELLLLSDIFMELSIRMQRSCSWRPLAQLRN